LQHQRKMGRGGRFSAAVLDGDRDKVPRGCPELLQCAARKTNEKLPIAFAA